MANYSAGTLELNLLGYSDQAVASINNTTKALNALTRALVKFENSPIYTAATSLGVVFRKIAEATNSINTENIMALAQVSKSINSISKISKLETVDYDKISVGFSRLTTAITPFIDKVSTAEASLTSLYGVLSKASGKKMQNILGDGTTSKKSKGAFSFLNVAKWGTIIFMARRLGRVVANIAQAGADYTETLNLWETAMGDNLTVATEFVNKMNEAYGISEKTLMNAQATFKNMLGGLGNISEQVAYALSEGITQMAVDYASLYNQTFEQAFTKFEAALAGQVRPIRSTSGMDITEQTLYALYQQLGGEKTMRQLNRTEKQLLSILAIFQQMSTTGALGDLNKTMNSFANQSRVWAESFNEVKTWLGVILTYTIQESGIMVKFNALLITASRYLEAVARRLGAIQSFGGADPFAGTTESAETATDAIDELNGKLLDFDKFRSLNDSEDNALGIDQTLINALQGYDSILGNATLEARKLSDQWLTALGFTIDANGELELTNEQLEAAKQKIHKMVGFLQGFDGKSVLEQIIPLLSSLGTILISILPTITAISTATAPIVIDIAKTVGAIVELLDNLGLLQVIVVALIGLKITKKLTGLATSIQKISTASKTMALGVMSAMAAFMLFDDILENLDTPAKALLSTFATLLGVILAIRGALTGGWVGATMAGLGIGSLLAGIKGLTSIENFANGGMPDKGTIFRAGEAGAEIVYNTPSGQSGVANVQQIKNAMYQALVEYGNSHNGGNEPIVIKIGEEEVFRATRKSAKRQGLDFVKV